MINYDNPEYDAIMEKANTTTDDAEQTELYKQAAKLLTGDRGQCLYPGPGGLCAHQV